MDIAVQRLIGPTSHSYRMHGYKEVELGKTLDDISAKTPLRWTKKGQPYNFSSTELGHDEFIFDANEKLVSYAKSYDGGPDDYLDKLADVFGKTGKEIRTRTVEGGDGATTLGQFVTLRSTADYTFETVLARVVFVKSTRAALNQPAKTIEKTHVIVMERQWVSDILEKNAKDKRKCIEWMKRVAEIVAADGIEAQSFPTLPGSEVRIQPKQREQVVFLDAATVAANLDRPANQQFKSIFAGIEMKPTSFKRDAKRLVNVHFTFDRYTPNHVGKIHRQPERKWFVAGGDEGTNALSFTPLSDMIVELNVQLFQEYFRPNGSGVKYVSPSGLSASYYEWRTGDGWRIVAFLNDRVTIERVDDKDL